MNVICSSVIDLHLQDGVETRRATAETPIDGMTEDSPAAKMSADHPTGLTGNERETEIENLIAADEMHLQSAPSLDL